MFRIVEHKVHLEFPLGHHLHCMICQIPNRLVKHDYICQIEDPQPKWVMIQSILDLIADRDNGLRKLHFLLFPEACLPYQQIDEMLAELDSSLPPNSVVICGIEHIKLHTYLELLRRYPEDNAEVLKSVEEDMAAAEIKDIPVNCCFTAIRENDGRLRVFFQAKSHPFFGEETIDPFHDLYRGKVFPLFRCHPTGFNFMPVICLDYIYRDLYQSNISTIIEHANQLFYQTRQRLDLLCVLQCNPKPEHQAFRDVVNGFYGEYLAYTPGVRDTITVFTNSSTETSGFGHSNKHCFGHSMVVVHQNHRLAPVQTGEFFSDDYNGLPVCRLRFGTATRLYYFNLPLFHELDPRTTRYPLKLHAIYEPEGQSWQRLSDLPADFGIADHDFQAVRKLDAAESDERTRLNHD